MEFKEFAQLMHPVIGGASSTHAFVKTLFDAIITEDGFSVLEEITEETYKAYFNGNTGISRIAKKISPFTRTSWRFLRLLSSPTLRQSKQRLKIRRQR